MTYVSGVSSNLANNLDALASVNSRLSAANMTETTKQPRVEPAAQSNAPDTSVTLSEAAKDKLMLEQQTAATADTDEITDLKSFAFGALGLDHPDQVEDKEDSSYTVGQYVKAAATIGGMIAMFV
ncbi:hypothetical protein CXF83_19610 [Shewanella sp. Choline-02u-19]|uniref:hypothetical protein n=1 Tax=unclassified Shewanella TaxID=196818 RepID=UPI000C34C64B|nr:MULTISPECIES: hypothetical protein [unclassified Shewanella]PKG55596.1 hypothetical protein CXF82_18875 [Shewanella sp. GutDb-MelDb]PKG76546.1 hypothetical protein CXF86_00190 [Shewanella sp. GutCb]PKH55406.1 hypothetical protein CXF84_17865 [Shewanella sp. Bg11-22]PKI28753.1 hypothetical protein CXF83_19610 [Shewanella sp. Choline-02u-19]